MHESLSKHKSKLALIPNQNLIHIRVTKLVMNYFPSYYRSLCIAIVQDVQSRIRKGEKGLVIFAGDVTPIGEFSHLNLVLLTCVVDPDPYSRAFWIRIWYTDPDPNM